MCYQTILLHHFSLFLHLTGNTHNPSLTWQNAQLQTLSVFCKKIIPDFCCLKFSKTYFLSCNPSTIKCHFFKRFTISHEAPVTVAWGEITRIEGAEISAVLLPPLPISSHYWYRCRDKLKQWQNVFVYKWGYSQLAQSSVTYWNCYPRGVTRSVQKRPVRHTAVGLVWAWQIVGQQSSKHRTSCENSTKTSLFLLFFIVFDRLSVV